MTVFLLLFLKFFDIIIYRIGDLIMNESKKNLYYGVLGILILLVMIIGSTFAYFSYRATSEKNTVNIKSDSGGVTVSVVQTSDSGYLFPLKDDDVMVAYKNRCIDKFNNLACNSYSITMQNTGSVSYLAGEIEFQKTNNLVNLYYMVLDSKDNVVVPMTKVSDNESFTMGDKIRLGSSSMDTYSLIIWLRNIDVNQNEEMAGSYVGKLSYSYINDIKLINKIENEYRGG